MKKLAFFLTIAFVLGFTVNSNAQTINQTTRKVVRKSNNGLHKGWTLGKRVGQKSWRKGKRVSVKSYKVSKAKVKKAIK